MCVITFHRPSLLYIQYWIIVYSFVKKGERSCRSNTLDANLGFVPTFSQRIEKELANMEKLMETYDTARHSC